MKTEFTGVANPITEKLRLRCREKFLRKFPSGFHDEKYIQRERDHKWEAHLAWYEQLNQEEYKRLLALRQYQEIAQRALGIEDRTKLLYSFEKLALRDAVRAEVGAEIFARGLFSYIYPGDPAQKTFDQFTRVLTLLPRKQTRVLTWPLQTVFSFIAQPAHHIFLEPRIAQIAAEYYQFKLEYKSQVNWGTYQRMLAFAGQVREDLADLKPRDMIDLQSFIRVQGSEEYG
jgi:hypothetical protein